MKPLVSQSTYRRINVIHSTSTNESRRARRLCPPRPSVRMHRAVARVVTRRLTRHRKIVAITLIAAGLSAILSACAAPRTLPSGRPHHAAPTDSNAWWSVRFQLYWPERENPHWYLDALLADKLIAPVLTRHRRNITLWRFHRRAARDNAGHRFSFVFYAPPRTAENIFAMIEAERLVHDLIARKRLMKVDFDDPTRIQYPHIEDSSDKSWPGVVQKTWPKFIMGASEMWLDLIHLLAESESGQKRVDDDILYRRVHDQISDLWKLEGQHPFLHHLNALFGYEEMIVTDRNGRPMRF